MCMKMGILFLVIFSVLAGEGRWWEFSSSSVAITMLVLESGMRGFLYIVTPIGANSAMVYIYFVRCFFVIFRIWVREEFQLSRCSMHCSGRLECCFMRVLMSGLMSVSSVRIKIEISLIVIVSTGFLISVSRRIHASL